MKYEQLTKHIIRPYRKGSSFILRMWETHGQSRTGQQILGYRLSMRLYKGRKETVVFDAADYGCSPMHSIDGVEAVAGLLGFLTLRKGDTDAEYFEDYTPEQLAFASEHAEALSMYCMDGDEQSMRELARCAVETDDE